MSCRHRIILVVLACLLVSAWSPSRSQPQEDRPELRLILVDSESLAREIESRLAEGTSFERLAREHSLDPSASAGGYMGPVVLADLRPEFQEAAAGLAPGQISSVTRLGTGYMLLQLLSEPEKAWMEHNEAGFRAFSEGRYPEALASLEAAVQAAEQLEPDRLAQSLGNLAEAHRLQGDLAEAEPLYDRAVELFQANLGPDHPELALTLNNEALLFHARDDYERAEPLYRRAIEIWEAALGPEDLTVAAGLNNLAAVRQALGSLEEAGELFNRSLEIREKNLGASHPDVAQSLRNLAELRRLEGNQTQAVALLRRSLEILEVELGPDHPDTRATREDLIALGEGLVQDVVDRFVEVVSLAPIQDEMFQDARAAFERVLTGAPVAEESYLAMADIFSAQDMNSEAEWVLEETIRQFPGSREAYYDLAELHVENGANARALEEFAEAGRLSGPAGLDPRLDAQMRGFISKRIGDLHASAGRFDEAMTAYSRSLEIDPALLDSRLELANTYFRAGRQEDALAEYSRVLAEDPDHLAALNDASEAYLNMGRFQEAADAAERSLAIDPAQLPPRLFHARALLGMGRTEEGRRESEEYQALEAGAQAEQHRLREIASLDRAAMAQLLGGNHEAGIQAYREAIEAYPDVPQFYFTLGLALSRLGRHRDAVETFLELIDLGLSDDFLIHKSLAAAYAALGNTEASQRHEAIYLEKREAEMAGVED